MKRITLSFDVDINLKDESEIDDDYIRELLCKSLSELDLFLETDCKKSKVTKALYNAIAGNTKSIIVTDVTIVHECGTEIENMIKTKVAEGKRIINTIKEVREAFGLSLKETIDFVRPFYPDK
jgi:ribosomal protein L7/L12